MADSLLFDGPEEGPLLVLAHGAGAPMDTAFMASLAAELGKEGVRVVRFEFPYMQARRRDGRKRPPDRQEHLLAHFRSVLDESGGAGSVFIGGKSMGGRMASLLATTEEVAGVIAFGYPFHPPGKPGRTRVDHFPRLRAPMLVCQGERDPMGYRKEVEDYSLAGPVQLEWFPDGDHDLYPRRRSGYSQHQHLASAARVAAQFIQAHQG